MAIQCKKNIQKLDKVQEVPFCAGNCTSMTEILLEFNWETLPFMHTLSNTLPDFSVAANLKLNSKTRTYGHAFMFAVTYGGLSLSRNFHSCK